MTVKGIEPLSDPAGPCLGEPVIKLRNRRRQQFEVPKGAQKGAARIKSVKFGPDTGKLNFTLEDGGSFEADVGQGRDLSDKD